MHQTRPKAAALLPALGLLAFSLSWSGALVMRPREGQPVAAFFPAANSTEAALARTVAAGAETVQGFGAWDGVVVARSDDPGFVDNLYRHGALLVVRAAAVPDCSQ